MNAILVFKIYLNLYFSFLLFVYRQLRIANQKIRDFESKIENLSQVLKEAEKRAVGM